VTVYVCKKCGKFYNKDLKKCPFCGLEAEKTNYETAKAMCGCRGGVDKHEEEDA
jgi:rRNA maturation endonuclease Nob1